MRDSGGDESVRNQFVTTFDGKSSPFATIFHSTLFRRSLLFGSDAHTKRPKREKSHHKSLSHSELHVIHSEYTFRMCFNFSLPLCKCSAKLLMTRMKIETRTKNFIPPFSPFTSPSYSCCVYKRIW